MCCICGILWNSKVYQNFTQLSLYWQDQNTKVSGVNCTILANHHWRNTKRVLIFKNLRSNLLQGMMYQISTHSVDLSSNFWKFTVLSGTRLQCSHYTRPVGDLSYLDNSCSLLEHLHVCFQVPEKEKRNIRHS